MRRFLFSMAAALAITVAAPATASCIGTNAFQTCNDASGNSYTVQRFGNQTMMQGHNSQTGSAWSQNSMTFGNTTHHHGQSNGNSWNMMDQRIGNQRFYSGTNSRGQPFSYSCDAFGNCY